jgi:hypothetical protein
VVLSLSWPHHRLTWLVITFSLSGNCHISDEPSLFHRRRFLLFSVVVWLSLLVFWLFLVMDLVFLAGFACFRFWVPSVEGGGFGAAVGCCLFLVRGGRLRMEKLDLNTLNN